MAKLPTVLALGQFQRAYERWQRMSPLGFVLLVGSAGYILLSASVIVTVWLNLRAHHLSYPWTAELDPAQNALQRLITFAFPVLCWFSVSGM